MITITQENKSTREVTKIGEFDLPDALEHAASLLTEQRVVVIALGDQGDIAGIVVRKGNDFITTRFTGKLAASVYQFLFSYNAALSRHGHDVETFLRKHLGIEDSRIEMNGLVYAYYLKNVESIPLIEILQLI
jgi:hypothetical protein